MTTLVEELEQAATRAEIRAQETDLETAGVRWKLHKAVHVAEALSLRQRAAWVRRILDARANSKLPSREYKDGWSDACDALTGPIPSETAPAAPTPRHLPWPSDAELACSKGEKACSEGCPEFGVPAAPFVPPRTEDCPACAKVARHPGEGYVCAWHPPAAPEAEPDTEPRVPGCQCDKEVGDSPCRIHGDEGGATAGEAKPTGDAKRTCNRHDDCDAAKAKASAEGRSPYGICCHDDCCEDCFGS